MIDDQHPSELQTLVEVLMELRDKGNTIISIEHDPLFIEDADYIVDMGPRAGVNGGKIVADRNSRRYEEI